MVVVIKVTDYDGNPIAGATVTFIGCCLNDPLSNCKISGINVKNPDFQMSDITNAEGIVRFYTGCTLGLQFTGTVSAYGYETQSYTGSLDAFSSETQITVSLPKVTNPVNGKCPNRYYLENGQCVQGSVLHYILSFTWLDIILIVLLILIVFIVIRGAKK